MENASYYRSRALQEQIAAQQATCTEARHRHDQLATMYRFRALMDEPLSEPNPVPESKLETASIGARLLSTA
jgi:hypothetical protein